MSSTPFPPPAPVLIPILSGEAEHFPVRRIYCVGRNYQAHRKEMGSDDREPPFFFSKPADAVSLAGADIAFPRATSNLHHEVELVIAIGVGGADIAVSEALDHIYGYAVGVDLTRRDLQTYAKERGQPWDSGQAFDQSAPISAILAWKGKVPEGRISLSVNGQVRQDASLTDMIWSVPEIVAECSRLWRLEPGDLIYTGTPEGVSRLVQGDRIACEVEAVGKLDFHLV